MRGSVLFVVGCAALAACGPEKLAAVKTTSSPKPPAWLAKAPTSMDALFFTGAKEGSSSLEEGKAGAVEAARTQAAQYIGVEISAEHQDVMSTELAENKASDQIRSRAQGIIRSAELSDVYYEKISRQVGSGTVDRYDVWVLLRLPRAEIARERDRQQQEAKQAALASLSRFREARQQEKAGDLLGALVRYRDVVAQTKTMATSIDLNDPEIATSGKLRQRAQDAASALQARARRAVLVAPEWLAGALTQALSARGFTARTHAGDESTALSAARADGAPWVIVARGTPAAGGQVFASVAATVALDVRALDARSGAVVASAQKQAKGVGRTPEAAQQAAASEAGMVAGTDLAAALVARENAGL